MKPYCVILYCIHNFPANVNHFSNEDVRFELTDEMKTRLKTKVFKSANLLHVAQLKKDLIFKFLVYHADLSFIMIIIILC